MNENHDACSGQDASLVAEESADNSRSEGTSGFLWSERFESEKERKGATTRCYQFFRPVDGVLRGEVVCRRRALFCAAAVSWKRRDAEHDEM